MYKNYVLLFIQFLPQVCHFSKSKFVHSTPIIIFFTRICFYWLCIPDVGRDVHRLLGQYPFSGQACKEQYSFPSTAVFSGNAEQYSWALKTLRNFVRDLLNASSHMDLQGTSNVRLFSASHGGAISMQIIFRSVKFTSLSGKIKLDSTRFWYSFETDVKL